MRNMREIFDDAFSLQKHSGNYVYHMPTRSATLRVADTLCYVFFCGPDNKHDLLRGSVDVSYL